MHYKKLVHGFVTLTFRFSTMKLKTLMNLHQHAPVLKTYKTLNCFGGDSQAWSLHHSRSPAFDDPVPDLVSEVLLDVCTFYWLQVALDGVHGFLVVFFMLCLQLIPQAGHVFSLGYCSADFIKQRRWVLKTQAERFEIIKVTKLVENIRHWGIIPISLTVSY